MCEVIPRIYKNIPEIRDEHLGKLNYNRKAKIWNEIIDINVQHSFYKSKGSEAAFIHDKIDGGNLLSKFENKEDPAFMNFIFSEIKKQ